MKGPEKNTRIVAGKEVVLDREGFVKNPSSWSEDLAEMLAKEAGLHSLTEDHWRVIKFIRRYYEQEGKVPLNHKIKKETGFSMMDVESMFPGGVRAGAHRLAGMPNPRGCGGGSL